jgi:hypothetical protein
VWLSLNANRLASLPDEVRVCCAVVHVMTLPQHALFVKGLGLLPWASEGLTVEFGMCLMQRGPLPYETTQLTVCVPRS